MPKKDNQKNKKDEELYKIEKWIKQKKKMTASIWKYPFEYTDSLNSKTTNDVKKPIFCSGTILDDYVLKCNQFLSTKYRCIFPCVQCKKETMFENPKLCSYGLSRWAFHCDECKSIEKKSNVS